MFVEQFALASKLYTQNRTEEGKWERVLFENMLWEIVFWDILCEFVLVKGEVLLKHGRWSSQQI